MKASRVLLIIGMTYLTSCARTSFKPVDLGPVADQGTVQPPPATPTPTREVPPESPESPTVPPATPIVVVPTPQTNPSQPPPSAPPVVTPPSLPPVTPAPICEPVAAITKLTKILFLVDMSGSNRYPAVVGEHEERTVPATDPDKKFRIGSIRNFVQKFQNKKNFQWGFITFGGPSATDFILRQTKSSLTSDPREIFKALDTFQGWNDAGVTPYKKALGAAAKAFSSDRDQQIRDVQYFVILLTDGYPTDIRGTDELRKKMDELLFAVPQKIKLSTIFYGNQKIPESEMALDLLQDLAEMGSGQFANVNDPRTGINIEDVIPGNSCEK